MNAKLRMQLSYINIFFYNYYYYYLYNQFCNLKSNINYKY